VNTNRRNPGAVVRYIVSRLENPGSTRSRRRPPWRRSATPQPPSRSDVETASPPTPATPAALAAARRAEADK
jgi:shikimate kinase